MEMAPLRCHGYHINHAVECTAEKNHFVSLVKEDDFILHTIDYRDFIVGAFTSVVGPECV